MEEPQTHTGNEISAPPETSLGSRLMNIFIAPGEVFDEIRRSAPNAMNWVVPLILVMIVGWIYAMLVFSQPSVIQGMKDAQAKKMQQQVDAGKLTRQQADLALSMSDRYMTPTVFRVIGILGVLFFQPASLCFIALIFWAVGKNFLGGDFGYLKAMEVVGMTSMISVPTTIIAALIVVIYGSLYMTPGPILLVGHFDPANKVHVLLSGLNLHVLWGLTVLTIGLSRMSGGSGVKSALWVFTPWVILLAVQILLA